MLEQKRYFFWKWELGYHNKLVFLCYITLVEWYKIDFLWYNYFNKTRKDFILWVQLWVLLLEQLEF